MASPQQGIDHGMEACSCFGSIRSWKWRNYAKHAELNLEEQNEKWWQRYVQALERTTRCSTRCSSAYMGHQVLSVNWSVVFGKKILTVFNVHGVMYMCILTGGWLSASCPHGVVYGLKFCLRAESPRDHVDLLLSMAHQPPVVINDMPHIVARHGNRRLPGMFHPHEGRLAEATADNINAAKDGRLVVKLDCLEAKGACKEDPPSVAENGYGKCHPVFGEVPHLCLYDRFHECNTAQETELLRRVTHCPQLSGLVNTQTAEQLHRSTVRSKTFLNVMSPSTHINMFRNIIDSRNFVINKRNEAKIRGLLKGKSLVVDSVGRLSVGKVHWK